MKVLIFTILLFCITGCTDKGGKFTGLLDREKMQAVMWDIIGADVFTDQFIKKDSLRNAPLENIQLQNKIFTLHKVTRTDFYRSYNYYVAHSDLMKVILDSMTAKAERDRDKMMRMQFHPRAKPK